MSGTFDNRGDFRGGNTFQNSTLDNVGALVGTQHNYYAVPPTKVLREDLERARVVLAGLPLDDVPPVTALPEGSVIAFRHNPLFVGRDDDLRALARTIKGGGTAVIGQTAAVTGLGGIGKTQLAIEFAHRYGRYFSGGVFFLSFADSDAITAQMARCGAAIGFGSEGSLDEQIFRVTSAWQSELPRLLIFDNCEEEALLERWRPPTGGARVMVTSRRQAWSAGLGVDCRVVGVLSPEASVELLAGFRPDLAGDTEPLAAIAEELGRLPLALHMAGSYLRRYRHGVEGGPRAYLVALRRQPALAHPSMVGDDYSPTGHDRHVARTFALSFDRLDADDPVDGLARFALFQAVCFAPGEPIPRHLIKAALAQDHEDDTKMEDALRRIVDLGLIEEEASGALVAHRLVAHFAVNAAGDEINHARRAVEERLVSESFRVNKEGLPGPLLEWQVHLRAVAEVADRRASDLATRLLNSLGYHLHKVANFYGAEAAYKRALAIDEKAYGPDHPEVATDVNNLGSVLKDRGDLDGAEAAYKRALAIDEKAFGPDHPKVASIVNNLGSVLKDRGDLDGAEAAFKRGMGIFEKIYGPNDRRTSMVKEIIRQLGRNDK